MFSVNKLKRVSSDTGRLHFKVLVHLLRYIRYNKNLGLIYYANIEDAPLSYPLRQAVIKTENQLMVLSDSICQDCTGTGISTREYIVFYQGGPIDNCTHVPVSVQVAQYSAESEYNTSCTSKMALAHFIMLNNKFLNKDPYMVP